MKPVPCPHCGSPFDQGYVDRHARRCVNDPARREHMLALLDPDGDGFVCREEEYDARRGDMPSSGALVHRDKSWGKLAARFGLSIRRGGTIRTDALNRPLDYHERNACKLRAQVEVQY